MDMTKCQEYRQVEEFLRLQVQLTTQDGMSDKALKFVCPEKPLTWVHLSLEMVETRWVASSQCE